MGCEMWDTGHRTRARDCGVGRSDCSYVPLPEAAPRPKDLPGLIREKAAQILRFAQDEEFFGSRLAVPPVCPSCPSCPSCPYRAEQGVGFQPALLGSFLKSELVRYGRLKYSGSSTFVVTVSH